MKPSFTTKLKGLTLTELLVVLAIMGVLILIAYPVLTPLFQRARSTEAKTNLVHLANLQKIHHMERLRYSENLSEIGFEQERLFTEGGKAYYQIEVADSGPSNFIGRATAIVDFDGDGTFNVWEIDKNGIPQEVTPD